MPKGDLRTLLWRARSRTVEALVYTPGTYLHVQLNPYDAQVVHVQDMNQGWINGVRDLHRTLLLGDAGRRVGHAVVTVYFGLILTGVWLRRPWRKNATALARKGGLVHLAPETWLPRQRGGAAERYDRAVLGPRLHRAWAEGGNR